MKKTRKFMTLFAILFVAIFAVSCCFFAACGNKDDNTDSGSGDADATVTGVTVAPTMLSVEEGKTGSVTATVTMSDSSASYSGTYAWKSDKESVATVSGTGAIATVTAVAEGTANITVTVEDQSAICAVTVTAAEIVPEIKDVITVATPEEKSYTTAESAVFENQADLSISRNGASYSVSGTASVMGEAEAEWYATDDVEEGTPYVVLKMSVAIGESVYFVNSEKAYENKEGGTNYSAFDEEYLYVIVALSEGADGLYGTNEYKFTFSDETSETYSVSFAGVEYPKDDEPLYNEEDYIDGINLDFSVSTTYSWIPTESISYTNSKSQEKSFEHGIKNGETYTKGFISLVSSIGEYSSSDPMSIGDELANTLNTAGSTSSGNGRYFKIDLAGYETDYVTIDVSFVSNSSDTARSLAISTSYSSKPTSSNSLEFVTSANSETDAKLSYGQEVTSSSNVLYITFDASVNIYTIDISIYGEAKPETGVVDPGDDEPESGNYSARYLIGSTEIELGEDSVVPSAESVKIQVSTSGTYSSNVKSKSAGYTLGGVSYTSTYALTVKQFDSKDIKIVVPESAADVTIEIVVLMNSSDATEGRTASLCGSSSSDVLASSDSLLTQNSTSTIKKENLTGGEYHITADNDLLVLGFLVTYTI